MIGNAVSTMKKNYVDTVNIYKPSDINNWINTLSKTTNLGKVKVILAIESIYQMESTRKRLSISMLSELTGLSRSCFYKNTTIRSCLESTKARQHGQIVSGSRAIDSNAILKELFLLKSQERNELQKDIFILSDKIRFLHNELEKSQSSIQVEGLIDNAR